MQSLTGQIETADRAVHGAVQDTQRIGDRVAMGAAMLWATNMLLRVMQLATTAILARLLTPSDYGVVAMATAIVGLLDILSNLQVGSAIMRTQDLTQDHVDTAFTLNMLRGLASALLLAILARPLSIVMHDGRLEDVLYVLALSAFLASIHNPHFLLFARNLDFRRDSERKAIAAIGGSCVGIAMALVMRNYWALVVSSLATSALTMLMSYWRVPGSIRLSLRRSAEMFSFGSWLLLVNVIDYINSRIDYFLIGGRLGARLLGAYHVGQQITLMATGDVVAPLSNALLPAFSIMSADAERQRSSYRQMQSITLALALPIGFGTSLLAKDIILLLVGKQWLMAVPVIFYLAPIIALHTMVAGIEALALANGQGRLLFIRTAIFLGVRGALMFAGFFLGGFMGIIFARVISGSFFLLYGLGLAARITGGTIWDPVWASWRSFVSVGAMVGVLVLLSFIDPGQTSYGVLLLLLVVKIFAGALAYGGTHLLLWLAAGRPHGAETRLLEQASRIGRLVFGRSRGAAA